MTDLTSSAETFLTIFNVIWSFLSTPRFVIGSIQFSFKTFIIGFIILDLACMFIRGVFLDE